ncbi:MAG: Trx7/PDZ domain-containing (seleno)protein [Pirellulales bacterium]|nr:Trx7/PDZ domain-containing (seleno)protein [Pirellulales bacterium]
MHRPMSRALGTILCWGLLLLFALPAVAQTRQQKVLADKENVEADGFWIYNDLPRAFAQAKAENKPLVVVLRCIPCEECVKLDDHLVDTDPQLRPLLEQFVRARVVFTNGLDLSLFQYDYDQSFAVFLLNADGTIYGRFGTRSHRTEWIGDVSIAGLAKALSGALELHQDYPANRKALAGKRGSAPDFATPEKIPGLEKYTSRPDYAGNVVQTCIHCHQIGDALQARYLRQGKPIPDEVLFPYPHPTSLGLVLDPQERATVKQVLKDKPLGEGHFQAGDRINSVNGQPILSIADVQWVLQQIPAKGGTLVIEYKRGQDTITQEMLLPPGWRRGDDRSWRVSTWELRRVATGGMLLEAATDRPADLPDERMALLVKHVGEYEPHDVAKQAGFKKGDMIISFAGRTDLPRETDLLVHALGDLRPGTNVPVTILREGREIKLELPVTKSADRR